VANTGVVIDTVAPSYEGLNLMARHNIPFVVLRPGDLEQKLLESFDTLVVFLALNRAAATVVDDFAKHGGIVVLVNLHGEFPWHSLEPAHKDKQATAYNVGAGQVVELAEPVIDPEAFSRDLQRLMGFQRMTLGLWNSLTSVAIADREDSNDEMIVNLRGRRADVRSVHQNWATLPSQRSGSQHTHRAERPLTREEILMNCQRRSPMRRHARALASFGFGVLTLASPVAAQVDDHLQCFKARDATNPAVGQKGRREEVAEWRLEVVCPESAVDAVVAAMQSAHSYEEPAFDVYALRPHKAGVGEGRLGLLAEPVALREFAGRVRTVLACGPIQVIGAADRAVRTVALACGAAGEFLKDAVGARADVFLTGEMRFHDYLTAQAQGVALVLPGHYATERFGVEGLAERLKQQWPGLAAIASRAETDPVTRL
jgi:putative NIF3 family GTP cyclohydrolase 1 type 2